MATAAEPAVIDVERLRASFANVAQHGDEVALWFYSYLFHYFPRTRPLFPIVMHRQRDRLLAALGHIVSRVDRLDELGPLLAQLGRDHRKFGALAEHYPAVGQALVATLAHFSGEAWSRELEADWREAYELVARTMIDAAAQAEQTEPAYWHAEVIAHERRAFDVAVLRVSPHVPLQYRPGQSISVETDLAPKLWRYYSPANAPRPDGTIDLHVQLISGGPVSAQLVRHVRVGDTLRLGAPLGHRLVLDHRPRRDLLLIAGGTGLAPLKAVIEQVAQETPTRRVQLFHGARTFPGLYDRTDLDTLAARHPWFTVTYALSADTTAVGGVPDGIEAGPVGEVVARTAAHDPAAWAQREVLVCGSRRMVEHTVHALAPLHIPSDHIAFDEFTAR